MATIMNNETRMTCKDLDLNKAKEIAFEALFEELPISFYCVDPKGNLIDCNDKVL
jgi:hypothetical protein